METLIAECPQARTGLGTEHNREVQELAKLMKAQLKDHVKDMSGMDYMYAQKFLESVTFEAQYPLEDSGLAAQ